MVITMIRKEDIRKELMKSAETYDARAVLWSAVKVLKKKDGGNFANLSKSFENACVAIQYGDEVIRVMERVNGEWVEDWIKTQVNVNDIADKDAIDESKVINHGYWKGIRLSADELYDMIQKRISECRMNAEKYRKQLAVLDEVYDYARDVTRKLKEVLKEKCLCEKYNSTLYYKIAEFIANEIKY